MELNININTDDYCNILIEDKSIYLDEFTTKIYPNKLKFSDTISIISILHSDTREEKLKSLHIKNHTSKVFKIPITFDGVFTVKYFVLPTKKWYDRILQSVSKEALMQAFGGRIYLYNQDHIIEITPVTEDVLTIEEFIDSQYLDNLSVSVKNKTLLSICKLRKCYVNLCLQIFDNKNFAPCWSRNKIDSELVYKRDLVWMTINVITYLWKLSNSELEIARLLSQVNKCNGLCDPYPNTSNNGSQNGCGCSGK